MLDLVAEVVEVQVREDGRVLWVNTLQGCQLRICGIKVLVVEDERGPATVAAQRPEGGWETLLREERGAGEAPGHG